MDAQRCDVLARSLTTRSRRRFNRALAGLGLAAGLGSLQGRDVEGKKRRKKNTKKKLRCKSGTITCGKTCIPETAECCTDEDCGASTLGLICVEGECICGARRGISIQAC